MNERLKEIRLYLKMSQKDFAFKIGLKPSSLNDIEKGRTIVSERIIIIICSIYKINEKWFRTGKGEMFTSDSSKFQTFYEIYKSLNPTLQDFLFDVACSLLNTQKKL